MRRISFSMTEAQFLDGSKTVTRRLGWKTLQSGERLTAVRKAMGLKKGEKQHILGDIVVVNVGREPLDAIDEVDVRHEGFPDMTPAQFVEMFCGHMKCKPWRDVTRIEFRRIDG